MASWTTAVNAAVYGGHQTVNLKKQSSATITLHLIALSRTCNLCHSLVNLLPNRNEIP